MSHPSVQRPLATIAQGQRLLEVVNDAFPEHADKSYGQDTVAEYHGVPFPDDVVQHLPDIRTSSSQADQIVRLKLPSERIVEITGQMLSLFFERKEPLFDDFKEVVRISYHLDWDMDSDELIWERQTRFAHHGKSGSLPRSKYALVSSDIKPGELKRLAKVNAERHKNLRRQEKAFGIPDVYRGEAAEIISFMRELLK